MLRLEVGHKLFWSVVKMEKQQCQFKLRVLEENDFNVVFIKNPTYIIKATRAQLPR